MTKPTLDRPGCAMALMKSLGNIGANLVGDLLSQGAHLLAQLAIELEAEQRIAQVVMSAAPTARVAAMAIERASRRLG
jgi:hypothetical protein